MIRTLNVPVAPRAPKPIEFPLSVLAVGEHASEVKRHTCPYRGCKSRLRWAPLGKDERGLVCEHHGVIWSTREEG